jgi:hypothetical protein
MQTISISQWVSQRAEGGGRKAEGRRQKAEMMERGLACGTASTSNHQRADELIPALSAIRKLKWTEVRAPALSADPKGIVSLSPGLRGTSYPGLACVSRNNPNGVASSSSRPSHNPVGVDDVSLTRTQGSFATLGWVTESLWDSQPGRGVYAASALSISQFHRFFPA